MSSRRSRRSPSREIDNPVDSFGRSRPNKDRSRERDRSNKKDRSPDTRDSERSRNTRDRSRDTSDRSREKDKSRDRSRKKRDRSRSRDRSRDKDKSRDRSRNSKRVRSRSRERSRRSTRSRSSSRADKRSRRDNDSYVSRNGGSSRGDRNRDRRSTKFPSPPPGRPPSKSTRFPPLPTGMTRSFMGRGFSGPVTVMTPRDEAIDHYNRQRAHGNSFMNDDDLEKRQKKRHNTPLPTNGRLPLWAPSPERREASASPAPPKRKAATRDEAPNRAERSSSEESASSSESESSSSSDESSDSSDESSSEDERARRKRNKRSKSSKKSKKQRKSRKSSKKRKKTESSSDESESSGSESEKEVARKVVPRKVAPEESQSDTEQNNGWIDASEATESIDGKSEGPGAMEAIDDDDGADIGPQLMPEQEKLQSHSYGGALRPGEGAAIANFVQKGMRIPRRGEIGLTSNQIESYEDLGYVMSGSRHKMMNAVRIRKENQVYSAEEKQALKVINFEEKAAKEKKILADFRKHLSKRGDEQ
eukprot:109411_1